MSMKNFQKFLEEASINDNPGIPGQPRKKDGEPNYLSDVERRAKQRLGINNNMGASNYGGELMAKLSKSLQYTNGRESELSELATRVFTNLYQDLIDRYEIEVDIKLIKPGTVKKWMDDQEDEQDNPPTFILSNFKKVVDEDIKNEVHKRKIANLIIQGEAKNTKHVLHSSDVKEGLREIYGDKAEEVFNLWDSMTKLADKLDWTIPTDVRSDLMQRMPDGIAGASSIQWKPKADDNGDDNDDDYQEEFFGGDEEEDYQDGNWEDDEPMERFDKTPIIRARGIDFPMLLHESVKGLFELLSIGGIPEDKKVAEIALGNTGIKDEPEDWKYGPEIASDLRDFINENKSIDLYPNIREEVYKMMIDKDTMPTQKFLELMRGILSKTDKARRDIDRLIAKVIEDKKEMEQYKKDLEEYNRQMAEYEKDQLRRSKQQSNPVKPNSDQEEETESEVDYESMSPSELQAAMDDALDNDDYQLAHKISSYMKNESKNIYDKELKSLTRRKNRHRNR